MADADLQRYAAFFEALRPETLERLSDVMTEDVHFVDPFNDVHGLEQTEKIFRHMFDNLENARFVVTHSAITDGADPRGLLRWELDSLYKGRPYRIAGMSEVGFAPDGRVNEHIDHWDAAAQFYERLPVVGSLLRLIRSRLQV